MTDAAHLMRQDSIDKKRISRGAHNRVGHTRKCSLPSDYLTAKQIKEMNGPVSTYNLSRPMRWETLKTMPEDLQRQYLDGLVETYGATDDVIANMLGVHYATINKLSHELGRTPPRRMSAVQLLAWDRFLNGDEENVPTEEPEIQVTESVRHCVPRERVPAVEFDNGMLTLRGAKGAVLQKLFEVLPEQVKVTVEFSRISVAVKDED